MVLGLEMTSLYLSCGLCHSISPQWMRNRNTGKKVARAISNTVRPTYVSGIHAVAGLGQE
eukprot:scaffold400523_cov35-Attheya_sp.AAC.1